MNLLERISNDRVVMIACMLLGLGRGALYLFYPGISDMGGYIDFLKGYVPLVSYGFVWGGAGLIAAVAVFSKRFRPLAYGVFIGLSALWAIVFFGSWVSGNSPTGFVNTLSYGVKALLLYVVARTPDIDRTVIALVGEDIAEYGEGGK